eukprot:15364560-Alexandrium_andersonii.AAC.1
MLLLLGVAALLLLLLLLLSLVLLSLVSFRSLRDVELEHLDPASVRMLLDALLDAPAHVAEPPGHRDDVLVDGGSWELPLLLADQLADELLDEALPEAQVRLKPVKDSDE